jgi:hypothetical protein
MCETEDAGTGETQMKYEADLFVVLFFGSRMDASTQQVSPRQFGLNEEKPCRSRAFWWGRCG